MSLNFVPLLIVIIKLLSEKDLDVENNKLPLSAFSLLEKKSFRHGRKRRNESMH